MATYYCISSPSHCYMDFLLYYLNKASHQNIATANSGDSWYKDIATKLTKTIDSTNYKKYVVPYGSTITASTVSGWADAAAIETALNAEVPKVGIHVASMTNEQINEIVGDDGQEDEKVEKYFFHVNGTAGDSIWGAPWGSTVDTTSYDKLKTNSNVKFIFVDFADTSSSHFDKWWSRVEASHASDSSWTANKDAYKSQSITQMGCSEYTTEDIQPEGTPNTSVTVRNYPLGYPTDANCMVLQIDKLLNKDADTKTELANFIGVNTVDLNDNIIDEFKSDIS